MKHEKIQNLKTTGCKHLPSEVVLFQQGVLAEGEWVLSGGNINVKDARELNLLQISLEDAYRGGGDVQRFRFRYDLAKWR